VTDIGDAVRDAADETTDKVTGGGSESDSQQSIDDQVGDARERVRTRTHHLRGPNR